MAKKKQAASPLTIQELVADLSALFLKYDGSLWKVKDATVYAQVAQLVAVTASTLLAFRR